MLSFDKFYLVRSFEIKLTACKTAVKFPTGVHVK